MAHTHTHGDHSFNLVHMLVHHVYDILFRVGAARSLGGRERDSHGRPVSNLMHTDTRTRASSASPLPS